MFPFSTVHNFPKFLLDLLEPVLANLESIDQLGEIAHKTALSISGKSTSEESAVFVVLSELDGQTIFVNLSFARDLSGSCFAEVHSYPVKELRGRALFFGSGNELFPDGQGLEIGPIIEMYKSGHITKEFLPAVVAHYFSTEVRRKQHWQAPGVGGAFFGFLLSQGVVFPSSDALHVTADEADNIRIIFKVLFRSGIFLAKNFITGELGWFLPLDLELKRSIRKVSLQADAQITKEVNSIPSKITLLDLRNKANPSFPNVSVISDPNFRVLVENDLPHNLAMRVDPNSTIEIGFGSFVRNLKIQR